MPTENIVNVPIENVQYPTYVKTFLKIANPLPEDVFEPRTLDDADLEIYSGFIQIQAQEGSGVLQRYTYRSFVPMGPSRIRSYDIKFTAPVPAPPQDGPPPPPPPTGPAIFTAGVNVSLAAIASSQHASTTAIDQMSISKERLVIPGAAGRPALLVLAFDIGIRQSEIIRVAYTVTVSSKSFDAHPDIPDLPAGTVPVPT